MLHSTIVIAGLFLLVELVAAQRGDSGDKLQPAMAVREPVLLGLMLIFGAASAAGLPPLPGFLGKIMVLQSSAGLAPQAWVWSVVLLVGFFSLVGLARAGVVVFWHIEPETGSNHAVSGSSPKLLSATLALMVVTVAMAVLAAPIKAYTDAAALQLADKPAYFDAVLRAQGGAAAKTTRPYDGVPPAAHTPGQPAPKPPVSEETR
jgi:multicomponent K+:H+ antiporter subunit D